MTALRVEVSSPESGTVVSNDLNLSDRSFTWTVANLASTSNCRFSVIARRTDSTDLRLTSTVRVITAARMIAGYRIPFGVSAGTASSARFLATSGMATDGSGYLYVADTNIIWKISIASGEVQLFAGIPNIVLGTNSTDDTTAILRAGQLAYLGGYLYYTDWSGNTIRRVSTAPTSAQYRTIELVAGLHGNAGSADGVGTAARFRFPYGLTTDGTLLYIADQNNHTIRKLDPSTGNVTTLSGLAGAAGNVNSTGALSRYNAPRSLTYSAGFVYVADGGNYIRKVDASTGAATLFAGTGGYGCLDGAAGSSTFTGNGGLSTDGTDLFVADQVSHTVRRVSLATGASSTIVGACFQDGLANGNGLTTARLTFPNLSLPIGSTLYIVESRSGTIRAVDLFSGTVSAFAGALADSGLDPANSFWNGSGASVLGARGLFTDDGNRFYFTDYRASIVRQLDIAANTVTTIAGSPGQNGYLDAIGSAARFNYPMGVAKMGAVVYVCDHLNNSIRAIDTATLAVTVFAGSTAGTTGTSDGVGTAARFSSPYAIVTDGSNLYVTDRINKCIRTISSGGAVSTLAGTCGSSGTADGVGAAARFTRPEGLAISTDLTTLYVTDSTDATIRQITIATGNVVTVAGLAGSTGTTDGTGSTARFSAPTSLHVLGNTLYCLDGGSGRLRAIDLSSFAVTTVSGDSTSASGSPMSDASLASLSCTAPAGMTGFGTKLMVSCDSGFPLRVYDMTNQIGYAAVGKKSQNAKVTTYGARDGNAVVRIDGYQPDVVFYNGYLYSADEGNHVIVRLNSDGTGRTVVAGSYGVAGTTDGVGAAARLTRVSGMDLIGDTLYFGQPDSGTVRSLNLSTLAVTTIAGTANSFGSADGTGAAARFYNLQDIFAESGALYLVDRGNHLVRTLSLDAATYGKVETIAGTVGATGSVDAEGTAASFNSPSGITGIGEYLYVCDSNNHTVRRIHKTSHTVTTLVGSAGIPGNLAGVGTAARLVVPEAITTDGVSLFVRATGVVWRIEPTTGSATQLLGTADRAAQSTDSGISSVLVPLEAGLRFISSMGLLSVSRQAVTVIN